MNSLAAACFAIGILVIATRGPLIFAPHETLAYYRKLFETDGRVRLLGLLFTALGLALLWAGQDPGVGDQIAFGFGCFLLALAVIFMLIFPGPFRRLADGVLEFVSDRLDHSVPRAVGIMAVAFGVLLIYLGFRLLD